MKHPMELAREHGLVPQLLSRDIAKLTGERPDLAQDFGRLAAALRGLGYSNGEVDARLAMAGVLQ